MRQYGALCAAFFLFALVSVAQEKPRASRTSYTTEYEAEWNMAWYEKAIGKLLGKLPSRFLLHQVRWTEGKERRFLIELTDDEGGLWARLHSDTLSHESVLWLPGKPKRTFDGSMIRFIRECERLFGNASRASFSGEFRFGKEPLFATLKRERFPPAPGNSTERFVLSSTDTAGARSIEGIAEVSANPHPFHYSFISVYFVNDEMGLTLREVIKKP